LVKQSVNRVTAVCGFVRNFALENKNHKIIKKLCPDANVDDGTPIHGAEAANADRQAQQIAELAK